MTKTQNEAIDMYMEENPFLLDDDYDTFDNWEALDEFMEFKGFKKTDEGWLMVCTCKPEDVEAWHFDNCPLHKGDQDA